MRKEGTRRKGGKLRRGRGEGTLVILLAIRKDKIWYVDLKQTLLCNLNQEIKLIYPNLQSNWLYQHTNGNGHDFHLPSP